MCGRFALGYAIENLPQEMGNNVTTTNDVTDVTVDNQEWHIDTSKAQNWSGSYNIAPTNTAVILYQKESDNLAQYTLETSLFGLVPFYFKPNDDNSEDQRKQFRQQQLRTFNCRRETITLGSSPIWNTVKNHHRCVIPAQGYYEWKTEKGIKKPYFVHNAHSPLIWLVGLYSHNENFGENNPKSTFTICTGPATKEDDNDILWLHPRKPILVVPNLDGWKTWLDPTIKFDDAVLVLATTHTQCWGDIDIYRVGGTVGNTKSEGPQLMEPEKQLLIESFFGKGVAPVRKSEEPDATSHRKKVIKVAEIKKETEIKKEPEIKQEAEIKKENVNKEDAIKREEEQTKERVLKKESPPTSNLDSIESLVNSKPKLQYRLQKKKRGDISEMLSPSKGQGKRYV